MTSGYGEAIFYVQSRAAAHANKARRGISLDLQTEDVYTELGTDPQFGFTLRPIIFTDLEVTFARLHILFVEIVCFAFAFYRISCSLSKILKIVDTAHLEVDKL